MSERISPTTAAVSAQALALVSREFRSRQQTADRPQSSVRPATRAASPAQTGVIQPQADLPRQQAVQRPQNNRPANTVIIPSEVITQAPPRAELIIRANDLQQQAKQLDGLVSDQGVSALQRTVLMSRAKDLKRQVSELDSIVTSQFQEDQNKDRGLNHQSQIEPAALFTSSLFRSSSAQQQPTAGALRAFAKNTPPAPAAANAGVAQPVQATTSQVDLIA